MFRFVVFNEFLKILHFNVTSQQESFLENIFLPGQIHLLKVVVGEGALGTGL